MLDKVIKCIVAITMDDPKNINITSDLTRDLGMDSLDYVEVIMEIEEEFGICIPYAISDKFYTVNDIVTYIEKEKN